MSQPLQPFFNRQDEVGAFLPLMMARAAMRPMQRRFQDRRGRGRVGEDWDHPLSGYEIGADEDEDVLGADDEWEEEEIDGLCGDEDEEVLGANGLEDVGASVDRMSKKLAKVQAKIRKHLSKMETVREGGVRWKWHARQVKRLRKKAKKLENKLERKGASRDYRAAKAALAAGGAGLAAGAGGAALINPQGGQEMGTLYDAHGRPVHGRYDADPMPGEEVSIPILFAGAEIFSATFAAGAAAGTVSPFTGTTGQITYANFKILGLKITSWIRWALTATANTPDATSQASIRATTLLPQGGKNLFYGAQQLACGGATGSQNSRVFKGLRPSGLLEKNETVEFTGTISNVFPTTASTGEFVCAITAELMLKVYSDSKL